MSDGRMAGNPFPVSSGSRDPDRPGSGSDGAATVTADAVTVGVAALPLASAAGDQDDRNGRASLGQLLKHRTGSQDCVEVPAQFVDVTGDRVS
jgi:hypothetical protein